MSLFNKMKGLFQKDKQPEVSKAGAGSEGPGLTVGKPVEETPKEKPYGGTIVRPQAPQQQQAQASQQIPGGMAQQSASAGKAPRVYSTGDLIANRYKVENVMSGAMGHVYICKDINQRIMFAIKQPKEEMLADSDLYSRVLLEADAWTKLGMHPNIAYCYFVKAIDEVPHIFIEYVDGGSLEDWISDRRCADYKVGIDMAIQFCHGLERAHERGMVHRDIKPRNVLVTKGGQVKVTDFGLVGGGKMGGKVGALPGNIHGTRLGDMMGTPAYMPPEQWQDPRQKSSEAPNGVWYESDVYSFGVCMWEMFCGRRPYEVSIGVTAGPPDPKDLKIDIPAGLRELLLKSVELDRHKRQTDFRQLREELNGAYRELFGADAPNYQIKLHDTTADELNNQGYSYLELGKKEEARNCFEEAVKADNTHPETVFNLALLQWRDCEIDDVEALKRIRNCASNPAVNKEKIAELLAYVHAERFDDESAKEELREYISKFDELFQDRKIGATGLIRTFEGHSKSVNTASLSSDGKYAVSGSHDMTLRKWEVETGKCLHTFDGHGDLVASVSMSSDGRYAIPGCGRYPSLAANKKNTLKLLEVETGNILHTFEGHHEYISSVSLSSDSRYVISGSWDKTLKLWNVETGKLLRIFEGHDDSVESVSLSVDRKYTISGSRDKTLKLWEVETGKCLRTFEGHSGGITSVSLSLDGKYVVSGSGDKTLKLWDVETGKCLRTFKGHRGGVTSANLSSDGRYVVSGSGDKTLKLWEIESGKCVRTFEGHSAGVNSVALSSDGRYALSGSLDSTLKLWEVNVKNAAYISEFQLSAFKSFDETKGAQDELRLAITEAEGLITDGKYSRAFAKLYGAWEKDNFKDNKYLLRVYQKLYSVSSTRKFAFGRLENTFEGHSAGVNSVALSSDGSYALSGSCDNTLKLWDVETGECLRTFEGHSTAVNSVSLSSDGKHALSGSNDYTLKLWEVTTGKCLRTFEGHRGGVSFVSLHADCRNALSGSYDSTLKLWDLETGECMRTFNGHSDSVHSVSLSADGRYAFSGSSDTTPKLWDIETGECVRTFKEGDSAFIVSPTSNRFDRSSDDMSASLSSDCRYAFSGNCKTLKLWEVETGKLLRSFEGPSYSVSFNSDDRYALSGSKDGTLRLWEIETGKCVRTFEGHKGRVDSVCLSFDGRYALSGSWDKTLKLWRLIWKLEFDDEK
jgi:WD40 repeat protein